MDDNNNSARTKGLDSFGSREGAGRGLQRASSATSSSTSSGISSTITGGIIERSLGEQQEKYLDHSAPQGFSSQLPSPFRCFLNALLRKKPLDCRTDTHLNRCLNMLDLTALGVGSTLGLGLYVLAGQVASNKAGPAVVVSFGLAALASAFSALCYAEFAGRVPRAGSAYAYSYITVGEFVAFIIGWNLILEYVIGCSSVARGFSEYLRFVSEHLFSGHEPPVPPALVLHSLLPSGTKMAPQAINQSLSAHTLGLLRNGSLLMEAATLAGSGPTTPLQSLLDYLVRYFDWPSLVIITVITVFVLFGVKESTNVTMFFTGLNLLVVLIVLVSSLGQLNLHNWRLGKEEVPAGFGEGGFLPYGWSGVLAGSATCFFGFIGFDTIASSAEEAKNPKKNVPRSIVLSLFISFLAYMAIATVQTLLWPYYDQDMVTILPHIFSRLGMRPVYWFVLLGAIAGLASSQLGGMYPLPRILYSMANDKLIYSQLAHINHKLKLPVRATITGSVFIALLSCLLDIQDLADMVSIGTLAAYSLVSISVLILRYENKQNAIDDSTILNTHINHLTFNDILNTMEESTVEQSNLCSKIAQESCDKNPNRALSLQSKERQAGRQKLAPKASTPIREMGSIPLVPQLSVGFDSWFKNNHQEDFNTSNQSSKGAAGSANKRYGYLDLLITWKTDDSLDMLEPDEQTSRQSKILILLIVLLTLLFDLVVLLETRQPRWLFHDRLMVDPTIILHTLASILLVSLAAVMLMLSRLPVGLSADQNDMFRVPLVPLVPTLSILVNILLMLNLSYLTWVRFTVWMAFGLFIYFTYGIWNSEGYLLYLNR